MNNLFAKSWRGENPPDSVFLRGHLEDVYSASLAVLDASGASQLRAFGLGNDYWLERLQMVVSLAAAIHDLGKANAARSGYCTRVGWRRANIEERWVGIRAVHPAVRQSVISSSSRLR